MPSIHAISPFLKRLRRVGLMVLWAVVMAHIVLLSLVLVFKERWKQQLLATLGKDLHGKLAVQRVEVDVWQAWPQLTLRLQGVQLFHTAEDARHFGVAGGRMAHLQELQLSLSLSDLWAGKHRVQRLSLVRPQVQLVCDAKGKWNYEALLGKLLQPSADTTAQEPLALFLDKLLIQQGSLRLQDHRSRHRYAIDSLDLALSGSFVRNALNLRMQARWHVAQLQLDKLSLLPHQTMALEGQLQAEPEKGRIAVQHAMLTIAGLQLHLKGSYTGAGVPSIDLHARTEAPLAALLRVLPGFGLETSGSPVVAKGQCSVQARYHGPLTAATLPVLDVRLGVSKGDVRYPDFPEAHLQALALVARLHLNPNDNSHSFLALDTLSGDWGNGRRLAGAAKLTNFSRPHLAAHLQTEADMRELAVAIPALRALDSLQGQMALHLKVRGYLPDAAAQVLDHMTIDGSLQLKHVGWRPAGLSAALHQVNGTVGCNSSGIRLEGFTGQLGSMAWALDGHSANLWTWLLGQAPQLEMQARLRVPMLDVDQLLALQPKVASPSATPVVTTSATPALSLEALPAMRWLLTLQVDQLRMGGFSASALRAQVKLEPPVLKLTDLHLQACGGQLDGELTLVKQHVETALQLKHVDIGAFFAAFPQLATYTVIGPYLKGRLSTQVTARADLDARLSPTPASLVVEGQVQVQQGALLDFPLVEEMSGFMKVKRFRNIHFQDMQTRFGIRNQRFWLDTTTLYANDLHMRVHGSHSLEGQLAYYVAVQTEAVLSVQKKPNKPNEKNPEWAEWVAEAPNAPAAAARSHIYLLVKGTTTDPQFALDTKAMKQELKQDLRKEGQEWKTNWAAEGLPTLGKKPEARKRKTPSARAADWIDEQP